MHARRRRRDRRGCDLARLVGFPRARPSPQRGSATARSGDATGRGDVRTRLRRDLIAALKAQDDVAIVALRSAIAAIDNAEAVDVRRDSHPEVSSEHVAGASAGVGSSEAARRVLSDADERAVVRAEADERSDAAAEYQKAGHRDVADRLRREADVLLRYLPAADSDR